jgi:hypothetical protein
VPVTPGGYSGDPVEPDDPIGDTPPKKKADPDATPRTAVPKVQRQTASYNPRKYDNGVVPGTPYETTVTSIGDKSFIEGLPSFNQGLRNLISNIFTAVLANAGATSPGASGLFGSFLPGAMKSLGQSAVPVAMGSGQTIPRSFGQTPTPQSGYLPPMRPPSLPSAPTDAPPNAVPNTGGPRVSPPLPANPGGEIPPTPPLPPGVTVAQPTIPQLAPGQQNPNGGGSPYLPSATVGTTVGGDQIPFGAPTPNPTPTQGIDPRIMELLTKFGSPDAALNTDGLNSIASIFGVQPYQVARGGLGGWGGLGSELNAGVLNDQLLPQGLLATIQGGGNSPILNLLKPGGQNVGSANNAQALQTLLKNLGVNTASPMSTGGGGYGNEIRDASPFGVDDAAAIISAINGMMALKKSIFGGDQQKQQPQMISQDVPFVPTFQDNSGNSLDAFLQQLMQANPGQPGAGDILSQLKTGGQVRGASPVAADDLQFIPSNPMSMVAPPTGGNGGTNTEGSGFAPNPVTSGLMGDLISNFSLPTYNGPYGSPTVIGMGLDLRAPQGYSGPTAANQVNTQQYSTPTSSTYQGPMATTATPLQRQATDFASQFLNSNPFASTQNVSNSLNSMISTGDPFDTSAQFQALQNVDDLRLRQQQAQNAEAFGAHGLRFGSDLARANAQSSAQLLAQESLQRAQIAQSAWDSAAQRRLQAIPLSQQLLGQQMQNLTSAYGMGADERATQEQDINRGLQFGEANRASQENAANRGISLLGLNTQIQQQGISNAMQQAELDRQAQMQSNSQQLGVQQSNQAADERTIQRLMAEFGRTQGALFPLLLQFALAGTEGDNVVLEPEQQD